MTFLTSLKSTVNQKGTPFVATSFVPVPATEFDAEFSTPVIKVNIQSLTLVSSTLSFFFSAVLEILGQTIDDAAGEAIDKCSKVMGLGYPGGPIIDKLARQGNPKAFTFSKPHIPGLDYSFSGLKTSFLYSLRDWMKEDPDFIEHHKVDLAASLEATVVDILMDKLRKAAKEYKIKQVAVAGGVSANNGLRNAFREHAEKYGWRIFIPKFSYTTDNAAMIAITGYFKYQDKDFCSIDAPAYSRVTLK